MYAGTLEQKPICPKTAGVLRACYAPISRQARKHTCKQTKLKVYSDLYYKKQFCWTSNTMYIGITLDAQK